MSVLEELDGAAEIMAGDGDLDALAALVRLGRGRFTLAFVRYTRPGQRDWVIARLRSRLPDMRLADVSLSDPYLFRLPKEALFGALENSASRGDGYDAVLLTDWEKNIDFDHTDESQPASALLGIFNMGRNLLAQTFPCPVVVFVPTPALKVLLNLAPDFVSWFSGTFEIRDDPETYVSELSAACAAANVKAEDRRFVAQWLAAVLGDQESRGGGGIPLALLAEAYGCLGNLAIELKQKRLAESQFKQLQQLYDRHREPSWSSTAKTGLRKAAQLESTSHSDADIWSAFRGAASLKETDELFGRDDDLRKLILFLTDGHFRCGTLWGETGCGKTSLVRGRNGLLDCLRRWGFLTVLVDAYGPNPEINLRDAVVREAGLDASVFTNLPDVVRAAVAKGWKKVYVVCDQFEQFFSGATLKGRRAREPFMGKLAGWVADLNLPIRFLLVLRADQLYRVSELDVHLRKDGLFRQLDQEHYHELLRLSVPEALKVLGRIREASDAGWSDQLLTKIVDDLAAIDGRVKPVELQLLASVLYFRDIVTTPDYDRAGGKEGLLTDYLNAIFDSLPDPLLSRFVVRSLVDPSNRFARPWRTVEEVMQANEVRGSADEVGTILSTLADKFHVVQRPEPWDRQGPERFQLVHDELIQPALTASTPQEIGIGIVRPALLRGRRFLRPSELRLVNRSELSVLPEAQHRAALRLVNRSKQLQYAVGLGTALALLLVSLTVIQLSFTHLRVESGPPYRLFFYSGHPRLDILPGPLATRPLLDTGLTVEDFASRQKLASVERAPFLSRSYEGDGAAREIITQLDKPTEGAWRCYTGDWIEGLRVIAEQAAGVAATRDSSYYRLIYKFFTFDPDNVRAGMRSLLSPGEKQPVRLAAINWFGLFAPDDDQALPSLKAILVDSYSQANAEQGNLTSKIRDAVLETMISMGRHRPQPVVAALADLLGDRQASPSVREAAARALVRIDVDLAGEALKSLCRALRKTGQEKTNLAGVCARISTESISSTYEFYRKLDELIAALAGPGKAHEPEANARKLSSEVKLYPRRYAEDRLREMIRQHGVGGPHPPAVGVWELPDGNGKRALNALLLMLDEKDPQARLKAVQAAASVIHAWSPGVETKLTENLPNSDRDVCLGTIRAFRDNRSVLPPTVERQITKLMTRSEPEVRVAAASAILELEAPEIDSLKQVINLLGDESPEPDAIAAERAWLSAFSPSSVAHSYYPYSISSLDLSDFILSEDFFEQSSSELDDGGKLKRTIASMVIRELRRSKAEKLARVFPILVGILNDKGSRPSARQNTLLLLKTASFQLDQTSCLQVFDLLDHGHAPTRAVAARLLKRVPESLIRTSVRRLTRRLDDDSPMVRMAAVQSLGAILNALAQNGNRQIDSVSLLALTRWKVPSGDAISAAAGTYGALALFVPLLERTVAEWTIMNGLYKLTGDEEPRVRAAAVMALGNLPWLASLSGRRLLDRLKDPDAQVRGAVVELMRRIIHIRPDLFVQLIRQAEDESYVIPPRERIESPIGLGLGLSYWGTTNNRFLTRGVKVSDRVWSVVGKAGGYHPESVVPAIVHLIRDRRSTGPARAERLRR